VLQAAVVLADGEAATRRRIAQSLEAELHQATAVTPVRSPGGEGTLPGWLRLPVILHGANGAKSTASRFRHLGIAPGYPRCLPELPAFRAGAGSASWPGASRLTSQLLTLPTHRWVTADDVTHLRSALR
jgi:dTDP-4-amino-4,6-dideoxygalactose transaminase